MITPAVSMITYGYYGSDYILYTMLMLVLFVIGLIVQSSVKSTFKKYSKNRASCGLSARDVAAQLLYSGGSNASIDVTPGNLTDHYNPKTNVVSLSESVYHSDSVSALAVAAHEIGHVMQHQDGYVPIKLRNAILPVAQIGSGIAPYLVMLGLIFGTPTLAMVGVYLFSAVFAFQLVTLPVEFNASRRALAMLEGGGYVFGDERKMAKKVLNAAAATYVVATLTSLLSLLRLISIVNGRRR